MPCLVSLFTMFLICLVIPVLRSRIPGQRGPYLGLHTKRNHFYLFSSHPSTEQGSHRAEWTPSKLHHWGLCKCRGPTARAWAGPFRSLFPRGHCGISVLTPRPKMWTRGSCLQRFAWSFSVLDEVFTLVPEAIGDIRMEYGVKTQVRWADISLP